LGKFLNEVGWLTGAVAEQEVIVARPLFSSIYTVLYIIFRGFSKIKKKLVLVYL
jgi:hypothetical protein